MSQLVTTLRRSSLPYPILSRNESASHHFTW